jgi:hypothetical protein
MAGDLIFDPPAAGDAATGVDTAPGIPSAGGTRDPSQVSGQDPDSFLGIPISYESGAGGSPAPGGESPGSTDPVSQPNQYPDKEPISGVTLTGSGAPGTQGITADAQGDPGADAVTIQVTNPSLQGAPPNGESGNQTQSVTLSVAGPNDSTAVKGNYPPEFPILPGDFYPAPNSGNMQPGPGDQSSHVMKGGFMNGRRDFEAPAETRSDTFPAGPGVASGGGPEPVAIPANPINTAAASDSEPDRTSPTDPAGTNAKGWVKAEAYPDGYFAPDGPAPWRQT